MTGLMGDPDLDLLILPVVVTTLVFGQAIEESIEWLSRHVRRKHRGVAAKI